MCLISLNNSDFSTADAGLPSRLTDELITGL